MIKVDGPAHKAREGGVILNVGDRDQARAATQQIGGPVLVAKQIEPGTEVFCGMVRDRTYGPVFALGAGGAQVEATTPVTFLGPLSTARATQMIERAGLMAWTEPIRSALLAIDALSRLNPRIVEVDVNPLICARDGQGIAVDALVVLGTSTTSKGSA